MVMESQRGVEVHLLAFVSELKILTKERGVVRLGDVMNYAQRELIIECERQLRVTGQIRVITLKARQIGISTVIEAIIFALSILFRDYHSLIVSHEKDSAEGLLSMTKRYWATYPFRQFHDEKYNGKAHLAWSDMGSEIQVATAKNVDAGRSKTLQALHASEVAFWDEPETLMTGLRQAIPTFGMTAIFLESTANGIGNYFHKTWNVAAKGESEYTPMFFPWWKHPEYTAQYVPAAERDKYVLDHLDEEERGLRKRGVPDERLVWRRWAVINLCQSDIEKFHQEYPSDPHEAFVSTGRNVFPLPRLVAHYKPERGVRGQLLEIKGKLQFHEDANGPLTVFSYPSADKDWGVYLIGADPTHTTAGDNACAQVLNRRTLEVVATYRKKIDPVNFGHELRRLGYYYNSALIAPEKTGPGYATVGALLTANYPFVWESTKFDRTPGAITGDTYGWGTNRQTKVYAISHLVKAFMDPMMSVGGQQYGLMVHDADTVAELRDYITTEDGQGYKNGDGSWFDDGVMALAIAVTVHDSEPPVPVYEPASQDMRRSPRLQVVEKLNVPASEQIRAGAGPDPELQAAITERKPHTVRDQIKSSGADTASWEEWEDD